MQKKTTTAPVSESNTVIFYLEQAASKLAVVSHFLKSEREVPKHALEGAANLVEEARDTIFEACHYGEIVRDYVAEKGTPLAESKNAMLKGWIDGADEKTTDQLILLFCGQKEEGSQAGKSVKNEEAVTV